MCRQLEKFYFQPSLQQNLDFSPQEHLRAVISNIVYTSIRIVNLIQKLWIIKKFSNVGAIPLMPTLLFPSDKVRMQLEEYCSLLNNRLINKKYLHTVVPKIKWNTIDSFQSRYRFN